MKKILYLIPLFLLFLIPKVYALPNCDLTSWATLYDINSATSVSERVTNTIYPDNMLCDRLYLSSGESNSDLGLGWSIRFSEFYPADFYYSITIFMHMEDVGGGTPYIIESPFRDNQISLNAYEPATNSWVNGVYNYRDYQYNYSSYQVENSYKYTVITYVVKPTTGFSFMFIPFATDRYWNGTFWFAGAEIKNLGSKSLTSEEITDIMSRQTLQIQNDLNALSNNIGNKLDSIESGVNNKLDDTNSKLDDMNSNITDSNSSGATDSAGGFFNNFEDNDFGLSGIITAPLNTIKTITSNTCTPLNLTIPFVNKNMVLPCMNDIYEEHFGSFLDIYQIITFGIISYWVCVQIYAMVKGFKNPDKDEIEVMDL